MFIRNQFSILRITEKVRSRLFEEVFKIAILQKILFLKFKTIDISIYKSII